MKYLDTQYLCHIVSCDLVSCCLLPSSSLTTAGTTSILGWAACTTFT